MPNSNLENDMMAKKLISKVDVLKVGHHGANTSTSAKFLSIARPTYSAISVGKQKFIWAPNSGNISVW
ncbi:hypothetical protein [Bacillus sp. OV322]|uniref:hypothetical protein n=1 Tax=Bacillus sp. OV322 TaxID=1882764 RepID=UPI000A4C10B2|nr:hypothetical protein [Bacillus sp. OV322]